MSGEGVKEEEVTAAGKKVIPAHIYELQILSTLPAKILQSWKVVCKDWLQLFTSSVFVRLQLSRCNGSHIRVLMTKCHCPGITEYNNYCKNTIQQIAYPPQFSESVKILGSADGLTLLLDGSSFISGMFNPSTRECSMVELRPCPTSCELYWFGSLGGGEYVLVTECLFHGPRREIWVYNFSRRNNSNVVNRICSTQLIGLSGLIPLEEKGTFVQGVVHWPIQVTRSGRYTILAYHLGENKCTEISPPAPAAQSIHPNMRLGLFVDGCSLCATVKERYRLFQLWVLKKDAGWTKYADIRFNKFDAVYLSPLGFLPNGDLIIYADGFWLIKYSFKDKTATLLTQNSREMDWAVMCADTLVSPSAC